MNTFFNAGYHFAIYQVHSFHGLPRVASLIPATLLLDLAYQAVPRVSFRGVLLFALSKFK
jgi:hypothetical protein